MTLAELKELVSFAWYFLLLLLFLYLIVCIAFQIGKDIARVIRAKKRVKKLEKAIKESFKN